MTKQLHPSNHNMPEQLLYSWADFQTDAKALANQVREQNFESLLIVTRGGLILGGLLAQELNIKVIETISLESYVNRGQGALHLLKQANHLALKRPLIVDDICDSGETLQYVVDRFKAPTAVLWHKPIKARITPTYYQHETDKWIVFPWEVEK